MGSNKGFEFTQRAALAAAKIQIQKLLNNNTLDNGDCQVAQLSLSDSGSALATFVDGSTQIVQCQGRPTGYALVCGGLAVVPEPTQIQLDSGGGSGYILGFTQATNTFYIRKIGSKVLFNIPSSPVALDSRIFTNSSNNTNICARIAADGGALVIGGFYQDIPADFNVANYENSEDHPYDGAPIEGFTYHTFANWIIYQGFALNTDAEGNTTFNYAFSSSGLMDLTAEATGKIPPPTQEGLGSSAVYRLFPSQANLYNPTTNTADGSEGYAEARFFPATQQSFTTATDPFPINNYPFPDIQVSLSTTSGSMQTVWTGDGNSQPLFMGQGQPWGSTPSNFLFGFNCETDGSYTLDIVSDITLATLYSIVSDNIQTYNQWDWDTPSPPRGTEFANCYSNSLSSQSYNNSIDNPSLYPFIVPFHNLQIDEYIIDGTVTATGIYLGSPNLSYSNGGESTSQIAPDGSAFIVSNGSLTAAYTYFGNLCDIGNTLYPPSPCIYFHFSTTGPYGNGLCGGPGLSEDCFWCQFANSGNFQITDWDGTFFSIDNYGPLSYTWGGFFLFLGEGGCNPGGGCVGNQAFMSIIDNFFFSLSGGFFDGYRFGRGICAFNKVDHITPGTVQPQVPLQGTKFAENPKYEGPSIVVSRLQSPLAQNHLYQVFRGTAGNTACTYQIADPYVIPSATNQQVITYQDAIDELNNPLAYNGVDVLDQAVQNQVPVPGSASAQAGGFSAFCYATNYTDIGQFVDPSNFVQPPDVMTDKILFPYKTWPIPYTMIKGVDSYVVQAYNIIDTTDPVTQVVTTSEQIATYNIDTTGLISTGKDVNGNFAIGNGEIVLDWILPLSGVGNN